MRGQKTYIVIILCLVFFAAILRCSNSESNNNKTIPETIVVNLNNDSYDEYIGRGIEYHTHILAKGIKPSEKGWLGNPHPIGWCDRCLEYHNREECIEAFKVE